MKHIRLILIEYSGHLCRRYKNETGVVRNRNDCKRSADHN